MSMKLPQMTGPEVIRKLKRLGFIEVKRRGRGSHRVLRKEDSGAMVTVACHGSKTLPIGTLNNIIAQARLTKQEFINA